MAEPREGSSTRSRRPSIVQPVVNDDDLRVRTLPELPDMPLLIGITPHQVNRSPDVSPAMRASLRSPTSDRSKDTNIGSHFQSLIDQVCEEYEKVVILAKSSSRRKSHGGGRSPEGRAKSRSRRPSIQVGGCSPHEQCYDSNGASHMPASAPKSDSMIKVPPCERLSESVDLPTGPPPSLPPAGPTPNRCNEELRIYSSGMHAEQALPDPSSGMSEYAIASSQRGGQTKQPESGKNKTLTVHTMDRSITEEASQPSGSESPRSRSDSPRSPREINGSPSFVETMDMMHKTCGDFDLHPCWFRQRQSGRKRTAQSRSLCDIAEPDDAEELELENMPSMATIPSQRKGIMSRFIGLPSSPRRLTWDIVGASLIMYDLWIIPLRVFDPPDSTFTTIMDWIALLFWTLSIFVNFTTAYLKDGKYERDFKKIGYNYLRFWFWVDILVVTPDWTFTIAQIALGMQSNHGSSVRILRILRLIRCMRLLRLAKLRWIMANIKDLIDSEQVDILFKMAKMMGFVVCANHFLACAWFAMGAHLDAHDPSWVDVHGFRNKHWTYQYVSSYHWAITQFTPSAKMEVQPQNFFERAFAVVVVICGFVGFTFLVGTITGCLTELRRMSEETSKQFWILRRFLKKSAVPMVLRIKIEKYLEYAWFAKKNSTTSGNLYILQLLTEQLKNELNLSLSMPHLEVHPLLKFLSSDCNTAMQRVASTALSQRFAARMESIFRPGEIAQHMSFVVAGRFIYSKQREDGDQPHREWVEKDEDWITEPALWTPDWVTLGKLTAKCVSELLDLSSEHFADAIKRNPQVFDQVSNYARLFLLWMHDKDPDDLSDICQGEVIGGKIRNMLAESASDECTVSFQSQRSESFTPVSPTSPPPKGVGCFAEELRTDSSSSSLK